MAIQKHRGMALPCAGLHFASPRNTNQSEKAHLKRHMDFPVPFPHSSLSKFKRYLNAKNDNGMPVIIGRSEPSRLLVENIG